MALSAEAPALRAVSQRQIYVSKRGKAEVVSHAEERREHPFSALIGDIRQMKTDEEQS